MKTTFVTLSVLGLLAAACAGDPFAPAVTNGNASFRQDGGNWTITTTSGKTVINWKAFSVEPGTTVHFQQPSAGSSVLNRVTGTQISRIDGLLSSNGRIYLLNPNGILVGPDGVIRVASFVGSTLALADADFLAGKTMNFKGDSNAALVNYGKIEAVGGDVYLIAARVVNRGEISAAAGAANLVAGADVLLTQDHQIFVRPSAGVPGGVGIDNSGAVNAAVTRMIADGNMYALAINNTGVARADGFTKADGKVVLLAQGGSIVNTGTLAARGGQAPGEVRLVADDLKLSGAISATGPAGCGLVETSASTMDLTGLTLSAGRGGTWELDPPLVIDAPLAGSIAGQLTAGTNVKYVGQSSITVASDIIASPASTNTYLWLGSDSNIAINANIDLGQGRLYLQAATGVTQAPGTSVAATRLWLGGSGAFTLDQPGNNVGIVSAIVTGSGSSVSLRDVDDVTIGTVKGTSGVSVMGGELHIVSVNGYVLANDLFGAGIVKEFHALGNVAVTETSAQSNSFQILLSNALPYSKTPAEVAAFLGVPLAQLTALPTPAGAVNQNGSAVRIVFNPQLAGDLLGYSWNFRTAETFATSSANDYAFTLIDSIGGPNTAQTLIDAATAASHGSAVQDTNQFSWETRWGDKTHALDGTNPYQLSFGVMNVDQPQVLSNLYLQNIFFQGHLIPPTPAPEVSFIFDRIFDHVEDFAHLRPLPRQSNTGNNILAPCLDELSTYFDQASRATDHRYYYESVGSFFQIPR